MNQILLIPASSYGFDMMTMVIMLVVIVVFTAVFVANHYLRRRMRKKLANIKEVTGIMHQTLDSSDIYVVRFSPAIGLVNNMYGNLLSQDEQPLYVFMEQMHTGDCESFNLFLERLAGGQVEQDECTCRLQVTSQHGTTKRWRNMRCQAIADTSTSPISVICTLTDETETMVEQQQERELLDKYRLIFDRSFVGLAFYDNEGKLIAVNKTMRDMVHFQDSEDPFYYNTTIFEMPLYRDIIDRRHIEELYFCTHIIIPERGVNTYLEKRVHPIFSDTGELVNIAVVARDISQERNLYHEGKRNEEELRQANADSRMYESELSYLLENCKMRSWHTSFKTQKMTFFTTVNEENLTMDFSEFVNHIIDYEGHPLEKRVSDMEASFAQQPTSKLYKIRRLLGAKGDEWYMMNTVPQQSDNGEVEGCFGLMRNVTSLISVQEQLKRETERANDSGRLKSVFLANMTHEIRTPLNAIVGFSDVLTMVESTEEKREMVRVIMNNCDMLLRLINDILEISTMDSNAIALEPEDVDFSKAFDDICETLQQRVHESTVSFIRDNPYPHLFTYLDTRRVQQVITNFVTNAVKYTNSGYIKVGYRVVDCPPEGRDVRHPISEAEHALSATGLYIYCEDTGAGIPKEKQSSVFERFVKLNDYIQGTGLGLSICKAIINRANGRIDVYSEGEGRGSTFWIWMPCDLNFEPLEQQDSTCSHD